MLMLRLMPPLRRRLRRFSFAVADAGCAAFRHAALFSPPMPFAADIDAAAVD